MNPAAISALAAIGGSSLGALGPVLSNYILQRSVTRRDLLAREIAERQRLYSDFITEAARLYGDAATQSVCELSEMVQLYSMVSRIRLMASEPVVTAAEEIVKTVIQRYGEDNISLEDLRTAALATHADPLHSFSAACRQDLQRLMHWSA